jgi:hypothetical protein
LACAGEIARDPGYPYHPATATQSGA